MKTRNILSPGLEQVCKRIWSSLQTRIASSESGSFACMPPLKATSDTAAATNLHSCHQLHHRALKHAIASVASQLQPCGLVLACSAVLQASHLGCVRFAGRVQRNQLLQEGCRAVPAGDIGPLLHTASHYTTHNRRQPVCACKCGVGGDMLVNRAGELTARITAKHERVRHYCCHCVRSVCLLTMHLAAIISSCAAAKRAEGPAAVWRIMRPIKSSAVSGSTPSNTWQRQRYEQAAAVARAVCPLVSCKPRYRSAIPCLYSLLAPGCFVSGLLQSASAHTPVLLHPHSLSAGRRTSCRSAATAACTAARAPAVAAAAKPLLMASVCSHSHRQRLHGATRHTQQAAVRRVPVPP